jgi:hypothetical protein
MTGHMPPVGKQGHGPEGPARNDLPGHGHAGQPEHGPRPPFTVTISMVVMAMCARMRHDGLLILFDHQEK